MDAELKAKWIAALRSGKYQQGQSGLRTGDDFCCLGVLCDVMGLPFTEDTYTNCYFVEFDPETHREDLLPDSIMRKVGLTEEQHDKCWRMNDDEGASFTEIADYIEKNL